MKLNPLFKRKITKKEWNLFLICSIIVAVLLVDASVRQTYNNFSRLDKEIKVAEDRLCRLSSILKHAEEIESGYGQIVAGLREIKTSDDFLKGIEESAKKSRLSIRDIRPTATRVEDLYKIYSVKLDAQDDLLTIAKFLYIFTNEFKGSGIGGLAINAHNINELPKVNILISTVAFKE